MPGARADPHSSASTAAEHEFVRTTLSREAGLRASGKYYPSLAIVHKNPPPHCKERGGQSRITQKN
jgi:hypothetical protein